MRMPSLAPIQRGGPRYGFDNLDGYDGFAVPPYGARWLTHMSYISSPTHQMRIFRTLLDQMRPHEFIWQPYQPTDPEFMELGDDPTIVCPALWLQTIHVICYQHIAPHNAHRVLRQFGCVRNIPPDPSEETRAEERRLHRMSRRGGNGEAKNWGVVHAQYVQEWNERFQHQPHYPRFYDLRESSAPGYLDWYENRTRRFISAIGDDGRRGFQTGLPVIVDHTADELDALFCKLSVHPETNDAYAEDLGVLTNASQLLRNRIGPIVQDTPAPPRSRGRGQRRGERSHHDDAGPSFSTGPSQTFTAPQPHYQYQTPPQPRYQAPSFGTDYTPSFGTDYTPSYETSWMGTSSQPTYQTNVVGSMTGDPRGLSRFHVSPVQYQDTTSSHHSDRTLIVPDTQLDDDDQEAQEDLPRRPQRRRRIPPCGTERPVRRM